jgi:hypothetical protein
MNALEKKLSVGVVASLLFSLASLAIVIVPSFRRHFFRIPVETLNTLLTSNGFCFSLQPPYVPSGENGDTVSFQTFEDNTFTLTFQPYQCPFKEGCPITVSPRSKSQPYHPIDLPASAGPRTYPYTIDNGHGCRSTPVGIKIQK